MFNKLLTYLLTSCLCVLTQAGCWTLTVGRHSESLEINLRRWQQTPADTLSLPYAETHQFVISCEGLLTIDVTLPSLPIGFSVEFFDFEKSWYVTWLGKDSTLLSFTPPLNADRT